MTRNIVFKGVVAGALALGGLAASVSPAQACGGFFCSQSLPVNQAAERIIFSQNGDGTVTAVIQILYEGPSESFSWLLPISSVPEGDDIAVASDLAFTRLQQATNPTYSLNTRVEGQCRPTQGFDAVSGGAAGGASASPPNANPDAPGGPGVIVAASGVVGAFDWTALELDPALEDPAGAAIAWLTENGYDVTPGAEALLGPYLADGNYLLALKLTKGSDTGSIRPIVLTYDGDLPMIPIKLTAVAANEDMGVMTWLLSETRAVPMNYAALELNEARINWFNASSNYNDVVTAAANDAGGQGFVTEFAGPTVSLANAVWQPFEEQTWQSIRTGTYTSFGGLFATLQGNYEGYDGFWDAIRASVTLPDSVPFADFQACPGCYEDQLQFSPTRVFDEIEANVIEPIRSVQELLDRRPYVTRLYSTLSAADMTLDPVFTANPDLGDVSNTHTADRVIECNANIELSQANWRIELPQGGVIRGTPADFGTWPTEVDSQPPNRRVLQLSDKGAGAVLADNSSAIEAQLGLYNNSVMTGVPMVIPNMDGTSPSPGGGRVLVEDKGCSLGVVSSMRARWLGWGSAGLLLALAGRRWRGARRRAG